MPTCEDIQNQLKSLNVENELLNRKEIKELPNILWDNERLQKIVVGIYNNNMGMLVATDKRLIFIDKGLFYGLRIEDFGYDKISSIQYELGILTGDITIYVSNNKAKITHIAKQQAKDFCVHARNYISGQKSDLPSSAISSQLSSKNVIDEIERLFKLKESGAITDGEFNALKNKLMLT
ncbi:MAG: PH domain-containing protein [Campylobacteraceae bacterium]|jgi:hypothetical protein|nr:PH domain-containing protein [Campylobacteraceae bacterium]